MKSNQANLLGMPNTIFGLMGFSALATVAGLLIMGVRLPRKAWLGIQAGVTAGLAFVIYLFFQGVFRIHAICPFCFLIWITMPPMFWYTTVYNLREKYIPSPSRLRTFIVKHHGDILLVWYLVFFGILLQRFWYYWTTLI